MGTVVPEAKDAEMYAIDQLKKPLGCRNILITQKNSLIISGYFFDNFVKSPFRIET